MFRDFAAVQNLSNGPVSRTVHRRGLRAHGKFYDLHMRSRTEVADESSFSSDYCFHLGQELASLDFSIFQDFVLALFNGISNPEVVGADEVVEEGRIFMVADSADLRLFEVLRNTLLSVVLNNYMSKFFVLRFIRFIIIQFSSMSYLFCDHLFHLLRAFGDNQSISVVHQSWPNGYSLSILDATIWSLHFH